jgi:hypothetical protein
MSIAQKILANPGKYSIQQLQQGVEHGIIPAYIAVPLIQEKVQQQKQMQMAQAMQQGQGQDQMPVAARVMQEAQGVEGLPTGLPEQYAGGGIIAFEDGGQVERYQNKGYVYETPYDRMNRLNREAAEARQAEGIAQGIMPYGEQMSNLGSALANAPINAFKYLVSAPGGPGLLTPSATTPAAAKPTAADLGPVPGTSDSTSILGGAPTAGNQPGGITGLGGASALGREPGMGLKAPKFTAPGGESYEASAKKFYETYGKEASAADKEAEEKVQAEREKVKGQAFDEYKSALQKEALDAGAEKDQAKYMSMFKAGLAMMAGTSRHALENIGKGAMAGAEDYQAAMKDLKKADRERQKELANIEQARRAEALGDRDTAIKRIDTARDRADARIRYTGEGIYKATNLDKNQAYDLAKTQFTNDSDIFRTDLAGRYSLAAADRSAEAKLAAALARSEGRGGMNQKQIGDALIQLQSHPEALAYRKQLLEQKGKKAANTPEFQQEMDRFVKGLFDKVYGGQFGAPAAGGRPNAALNQLLNDPSIARYFSQ